MAELIIISNRLPVSVRKSGEAIEVYPSAGGLATGLSGYTKRRNTKWIGWPGLPSDELTKTDKQEISRKLKRHHCYPVFLTKRQLVDYYNGYSNSALWPLFHDLSSRSGETEKKWQAYQAVNHLFADAALALSKSGSTLWVHDYQLLLVAQFLRVERPSDHIGFFLHIPFPSADDFITVKHATSLLAGMLGADLIGFHTKDYVSNFLQSCRQLELGDVTGDQVLLPSRAVQVTDFPMGIDYFKFARASRQRQVKAERRKLERKYRGLQLIVTVDRLDPAKGLIERLGAYEQLLTANPQLRGNVMMLMQVIPSREEVAEYRRLKKQIERAIERINVTFGTKQWQPIEYLYQTVPFEQLVAMYQRADVAFIAPFRDGMNLVAKEYLASQQNRQGALVLSQTAGAAMELKAAIRVDPTQPKTLVSGLQHALTLPKTDLRKRTEVMRQYLKRFTVERWANTFMDELQRPRSIKLPRTHALSPTREQKVVTAYHTAKHRLLLLDYDGVLRAFERTPANAKPSRELLALLRRLGRTPGNDVVIISGRCKSDLDAWFGRLPIALAAEHGALFKRKGGKRWHKTTSGDLGWKHPVSVLFKYYADQTAGAAVEQKEWAVVWHYRGTISYQSQKHLVALRRTLKPIAKEYNLQILEGHKVLEVRPVDVHKGRIVQEWLTSDYDFVLAVGDDTTDEDMFAAVPPGGYTMKVGRGTTIARFRLHNILAALRLLDAF